MKPLNRPMFRYGGPIKEGVMSGIREPRANGGPMRDRALLVGNPAFPMRDGRAMYAEQLSLFDTVKDAAKKTFKTNPLKVLGPAKKVGLAKKLTGPIKNFYQTMKSKIDMPKKYVPIGGKLGPGYSGVGSRPTTIFEKAKEFALLNPKTTGVGAGVGVSSGLIPEVAGGVGSLLKKGGLQVADLLVYDKIFDQDQYFKDKEQAKINEDVKKSTATANEKRIKELEALLASPASANQGKTQDEIRQERIQKYRDIMDIKGMNKTAAYDSLIAASQAVNQAGGDLKGAVRDGSLINQIIQSTSKAFDKPKKTKDAIDTLILKGEIEKDIKASDPSTKLDADYKRAKIAESKKSLNPSYNTLKATYAKANVKGQSGIDGAAQEYSQNNDQVFRGNIISKADFKEKLEDIKKQSGGVDEISIIENWTNEVIKDKDVPDGNYTVGDKIVTIQDSVVVAVE